MQLRFKKFCLLSTIFVYCASFLLQSNLSLFQVRAQGSPKPINIVAILVDDSILGEINEDLKWYATQYIQKEKVFNSQAYILPLDVSNVTAYDIYRMLENIYFDGLKDTPSTLVGLIMIGDIPLPVVNQNGYIFPTVYPYVDFEDQKYVWDPDSEYFVSNGNPAGQAEIWHGLINYGNDIDAYINEDTGFFKKLKKYYKDPDKFIGKSMWYDDFISQKKGFLDENFPYYRNRIMFAEDLGYQRYSPLMKKLFEGEQVDNALDVASQFGEVDEKLISEMNETMGDNHTTKMVQQEIDTSFVSDYNDLFSQVGSSIARENIFAGSRWIKEHTDDNGEKSLIVDSDSSTSKIQLKDDLLLGNENLQGLIENLNDLMEDMIDKKIEEKHLAMDIVVPVSYKKEKKRRFDGVCRSLVDCYENYYFGNNARFIDKAEDLSIYRGTYRNLSSISGLVYDSMLSGKNQIKSDYDKTNLELKSIGGSYDIFSMQVEGNRGYNMFNVDGDLDTYDENKTQKDAEVKHRGLGKYRERSWPESCDDTDEDEMCENLFDFAKRWWGGASPINLDGNSVGNGTYVLSGFMATDSWRPIYGMNGFQSLATGDDEGLYGQGWKDGKGKGPQRDATNFRSYIKYASPTQREGWRTRRWAVLLRGYEVYHNHTPDVHMDFSNMNYRNLAKYVVKGFNGWKFSKESDSIFSIIKYLGGCGGGGSEEYVYKVISSIVKHTSTTDDQINGIDRDKYGESGTLGQYYRDVRVQYESLHDTMTGSIDAFSGLIIEVNSGSDYLSGKFNTLRRLFLYGDQNVTPDTGLQIQLGELESQLSQLQEQLSGLEEKLYAVTQMDEGGVSFGVFGIEPSGGEFEGGGELGDEGPEDDGLSKNEEEIQELDKKVEELKQNIEDLKQYIETIKTQIEGVDSETLGLQNEELKQKIENLKLLIETVNFQNEGEILEEFDNKIGELNQSVDGLKLLIGTVKSQLLTQGGSIQATLDEISEYIELEKKQLSKAYGLVMSLYTDDIIGVLEFIAYLEGGQPNDYYEGGSNLVKVGFLPSWIDNLNNIFLDVRNNESKVVSGYEEVYSLIEEQQQYRFELAEELKVINEMYSESIDKVSEAMEQIFTITDSDDNDESLDTEIDETKDPGLVVVSYVYTGGRGMAAEDKIDIYGSGAEFNIDSPVITGYKADVDSIKGVGRDDVSQRFKVTYTPVNDENGNGIADEEEEGEEEVEEPITLTGGTAHDAMEIFDKHLIELSGFFNNLIKEDDVGPAIINIAKSDTDFLHWLFMDATGKKRPANNSVRLIGYNLEFQSWFKQFIASNTFSDVDRINKYAQWAKGPGYDSQGAKENHDLLMGVSDHMSGMNLLTPDRPIDSPRYVSMQSVAGREMKFIYPDLFKVEVYQLSGKNSSGYDINLLLTGGQIKKNLIKYLTGKVAEYNKIFQNECNNAKSMDIYSNRLLSLSYISATPNKNFHSCSTNPFTYEDFLEALGGEKMLDTISEVLYYQSITNKRKLSNGNIEQDLEFIKETFSLNAKRKQVLQNYLVEGNEEIKNSIFEIPTYDKLGYEVAYINSNGKDYVFPSEEVEEKTSNYKFKTQSSIVKDETNLFDVNRRQPSSQEVGLADECNIPMDGKLPLFTPWLQGFKCWLKKVKEEPFKLTLTFDNSLGEILSAKSFGDYVKNSDLGESFNDRKDSWSNYADEWEDILSKDKTSDSDAKINQLQVSSQRHNQEVSSGNDGVSNLLSKINNNIRIENSNIMLSDTSPTSNLKVASISDIGNVRATFEGTGDGCLKLNSIDLCNGKTFTTSFNPKQNPFTGVVSSSSGHVAGKVALIMKIGVDGGGYVENVLKYTIKPSVPTKVTLKVKTEEKNQVIVVGGMMLPINATLYDDYGNVVSRGTEKYKFTVTTGRFLKDGGYMDSFHTDDFRDLNFYYEVPENYDGEVDIQILTSKDKVVGTLPINVIKATLETKIDKALINDKEGVCHKLGYWDPTSCVPCTHSSCSPSLACSQGRKVVLSKNVFEDIYVGGKLDVSQLHKIDIDFKDYDGKFINIDNQVIVTSKKGLLVLGQVNKQENGDDVFMETSKFYMTGGHVELYYYLTTVAGNDVLNIDVHGIISRDVDFKIEEHSCTTSSAKLRNGYVEVGVPDFIEFFNADIFGNVLGGGGSACYDQTKVDFPKTESKGPDPSCGWNEEANEYNYLFSDGRDKIDIVGVGGGITEVAGLQFEVSESLIPDSGLNVLYLNYFGNDWGNQWGYRSNNNGRVESMMKKSKKLITTTTQLISEDKIKKLVWRIDPGFKIVNIDNFDTTITMDGGGFSLNPNGELSNGLNVGIGFTSDSVKNLKSLQDVYSWILDSNKEANTYLFYVPSEPEYKLLNKMDLYDGGEKIGNLYSGDVVLKLTTQTLSNGDNVWSLMRNGVNYGNVVIHSPNANVSLSEGVFNVRYSIGPVFTKGSTNNLSSIGVFDEFSDFELDTNYKSIQNSDEVDERVGFIGDFKNITLFGEGQSVGDATKKFGSELLINLGDPVLSLKKENLNENAYGMDYDGGIGREVFEDAGNDIFGTYIIDFDSNGVDDLLVAYADGTFKLAKNYANDVDKYDMRNLQELMRLAVPIKDVFVGGKKDIFVYTQNNQLRAYLNQRGSFDVDGKLVCLNQNVYGGERSATPSDLEGLNQFFLEDMDLDGTTDIITYDAKGYIKVFYGPGYLSEEEYSCDRGWYDRQKNKVTEVAAFGVKVGGEALDDSMMYRKGLTGGKTVINDPSEYGVNIDVDSLDKLIKASDRNSDGSIEYVTKEIMDIDNFNLSDASEQFAKQESMYVNVTIYGDPLVVGDGDSKNYLFVPIRYLKDAKSPCKVSKTYNPKTSTGVLEDGDIVTVSVNIQGCVGAYGDMVNGPRNLYYNNDGLIKSFRFIGGTGSAILRGRDGNFAYIVDNIQGKTSFEYDVEYKHVPLKKMSITHETYWSDDEFPDIKLQSIDGCIKDFSGYVNQGGSRKYIGKNIPLQEMIDEEYLEEDGKTEDFTEEMFDAGSDVNKLPGIVGDRIARIKLLQQNEQVKEISDDEEGREQMKDALLQGLKEGSISMDLSLFGEEMEKIDAVVDDLMKGMCNGFSFGGANNCKGLPVPFNQAFLAPGKYHLFGCWDLPMGKLEDGIPAFFFPGNLGPFFGVYIPFPYAPTGPLDDFLWLKNPSGPYSSFIRIYAAPTLTAQLGIAICMGPYKTAKLSFPSPVGDIMGNCVVFAVKPQCKSDSKYSGRKIDNNNPNEVYTGFIEDVRDSGVCMSPKNSVLKGKTSSPYSLYSYDTEIHVEEPCTASCTKFDTNNPNCGNGVKDKGETCDNCFIDLRHECQNCGNARKDPGEQCDNGLVNGYDGKCTFDCKIERGGYCGNGVVDSSGEVCDLGRLNGQFWEENSIYGGLEKVWLDTRENIWGDVHWDQGFFEDIGESFENIGKLLTNMYNNVDVNGGQNYEVDFSANYLGIIDLDMSSSMGYDYDTNTKNSIFIGDVDVLGGDFTKNKIKGGIQQGIRKLLIDNWLDPQIRYIANQLTKMHVNIKLPDMGAYLNNEIQTIRDLTDQFGDILSGGKIRSDMPRISSWEDNNYDNLVSFNKSLANPFEALASILNESNIINISIEPVTVKIPWIFAEDIDSYDLYLRQWMDVNRDIVNQWSDVLSSFRTRCASLTGQEKKECVETAEKNLSSFIEFAGEGGDREKLQNQIYANLQILQQYRNFPFEVYEWIHSIDRYMSEIISLISNTIGYLSYWTTVNAERFVGYVDAIILMINIIRTYQIIPDFSLEWAQKCGSCAKDTYDQYSCKLSFLCDFELPIIQIPNFKIPNITLDLSDIDLSLDIVLPRFNFQPLKISLPDLPNLPSPPSVSVDIRLFDLPNIPLLPEPPDLPELPSFIPEIDMELPILPPAPEIPEIPNSIVATLNIVKMFGKLYCIVKGKFGLVGESSVKAKIEQLTQRTYEVPWIDNIKDFTNRSAGPVHNYGLDYEISSHVDMQFDLSVFYDFLDSLTKSINNFTISSVDWTNNAIDKVIYDNSVSERIMDRRDDVDGVNLNFSLDLTKADNSFNNFDVKGLMSDEIKYTDYDTAKSKFEDFLAYFKMVVSDTTFVDSLTPSINKIKNQINKENVIKPNVQGLEKVENDAIAYLNNEKSDYDKLANFVNDDYDGFLAMIGSQTDDFGFGSGKFLAFNAQLFDVNSSTRDNIDVIMKDNPYEILLGNKKEIIDGFWNAINTNTANDLGLTNSQYLVMRDGIGKMKNEISTFYSITRPISSTELISKNGDSGVIKTLLSTTDSQLRLGSNSEVAAVIDPSVLSDGIYDKIKYGADVGKMAKIIYSDSFAATIGTRYSKISRDDYHDWLLWDDKSVYIKCRDQKCFSEGGFGGYHVAPTISSIPYEEKYIKFSDGELKIADVNNEVKNRKVEGQNYDSLSYSWKLEDVDGYLIDLTERIDYNYEKNFSVPPIYVLALPEGAPSLDELLANGTKLELIGDDDKFAKIADIYGTGKQLVQVVYYDDDKDLANVILSNLDRKWYYARIATLNIKDDVYKITSPWSNQVVAGKQMLGDDVGPEGNPALYRPSTEQTVSQGNNLDGYVGTRYNLVVNWKDDVALSYINLSKDGVLLDERYISSQEGSVSTKIDIHTKGGDREVYNSVGIDQFGNKTQKVITVSYSVPEISITDVSKNSDGSTALIKADLSQDIDQGNVSFQRKRGSFWKTMRTNDSSDSDITLVPGKKMVVGSYSAGSDIAIYDKNEKVMALMNPDTAEIKFQSGYDDKYGVRVVVADSLVLQIFDKKTLNSVFSIYVPVEDCSTIDVGNYFEMYDLKENRNMGMFNGGRAIYEKEGNNIVLLVSPTCHLYSDLGMEGTYSYDIDRGALSVVLYQLRDKQKKSPIKLLLKVKPLQMN